MTTPTWSHGDPNYLTDAQLGQLLKGINPVRVQKDPKGNSHVEAYEIRAHLNRIFGFGRWSADVMDQHLVYETSTEAERPRWSVCWYARVRLEVRAPNGTFLCTFTEGATGDATNQPSRADANDQACKTAASQALKRCAMNLGDQFGLSLYNKGSFRPLVGKTLTWAPDAAAAEGEPDAHITSPLAPERAPESGESQREVTSPPTSKGPVSVPGPAAADGGAPVSGGPAPAVDHCGAEAWPQGPLCELAPGHPGGHYPQAFAQAPAVNGSSAEGMVMHGSVDLGMSAADAAAMEADAEADFDAALAEQEAAAADPAGPSVPDAAGESRAASGEPVSSPAPTEEPAAEADPTPTAEAVPAGPPTSPTPAAEPTGPDTAEPAEDFADPIEAWEHITAVLAIVRNTPPESAVGTIAECMEIAVKHRLAARKYGDSGKALNVVLTELMRDCKAAIERRKATATT